MTHRLALLQCKSPRERLFQKIPEKDETDAGSHCEDAKHVKER